MILLAVCYSCNMWLCMNVVAPICHKYGFQGQFLINFEFLLSVGLTYGIKVFNLSAAGIFNQSQLMGKVVVFCFCACFCLEHWNGPPCFSKVWWLSLPSYVWVLWNPVAYQWFFMFPLSRKPAFIGINKANVLHVIDSLDLIQEKL